MADEAADSEGDDFEFVYVEEDMDLEVVEKVVVVDCQYPQQEDGNNCMENEWAGGLMISPYIRVRAINLYLTLILMSTTSTDLAALL